MTIRNASCAVVYVAALFEGSNRVRDSRAGDNDVNIKDRFRGEARDGSAPDMLDAEDTSDSVDGFLERGFDGIKSYWPLRVVGFYKDTHCFPFGRLVGVRGF